LDLRKIKATRKIQGDMEGHVCGHNSMITRTAKRLSGKLSEDPTALRHISSVLLDSLRRSPSQSLPLSVSQDLGVSLLFS